MSARIDDASSARFDEPSLGGVVSPPSPRGGTHPSTRASDGWRPRFLRALGVTLGVHIVSTLVAGALASTWSSGLVTAAGPHPFVGEGFAHGAPIAPETLATFGEHALGPLVLALFGVLALEALVAVPLQLFWLGTMAGAPLSRLPRDVARAIGASVMLLLAWVLVGGLLIALPFAWHLAFDSEIDPRIHDLGLLASLVPGLAAHARWSSWHDHTRAAISLDARPFRALRLGWRAGSAAEYVAFVLVAWVLFGVSLELSASGLAAAALAQGLVLGRTYARAMWLARAQSRVASFDEAPE